MIHASFTGMHSGDSHGRQDASHGSHIPATERSRESLLDATENFGGGNFVIDKIYPNRKTMEEEIFTLTDAIIANDKTKSLNLLEEFLNQNYDEMQIIMLLA